MEMDLVLLLERCRTMIESRVCGWPRPEKCESAGNLLADLDAALISGDLLDRDSRAITVTYRKPAEVIG